LNFRVIVRALNLDAATPMPALVDLIIQQARHTADLRHPHVTRILACTMHERFLVIVNEFVAGVTLTERLAREPILPEEDALVIVQQVAEGLQAGLQRGLLHNGVCPMHIRVTPHLKAKLADYCWHVPQDLFPMEAPQGHAPVPDRVASAMLPYRAPEHLLGTDLDHRADIYTLGATLYHLLAGRPCFGAASAERLMTAQRQTSPQVLNLANPYVSQGTSDLVMAMLAYDRAKRPVDYRAILAKLESCVLGARLQRAKTYMKDSQTFSVPRPTS
jgi:serine/threonine protein kinase